MSEYQHYEFLAIDRPLDARQQQELRGLSTRARITATRLVNTYHWGDFKGDPRLLMSRYFDAFLYLANWGTRQLMFRLPTSLLDVGAASRYAATDSACAWSAGGRVIVQLTSEKEDEYWEEGAEDSLSSIIPVRSELAGGDRRLLYLAWLLSVDAGESEDKELEPAVPPGLTTLSAALQNFVEFLRLDEDLLSVAAEASKPLDRIEPSAAELTGWVTRLPAEEKDVLLARLASGDPHLGMELARRFRCERDGAADEKGSRTVAELKDAARRHREQRARLAAQRRAQEQARREHAQAAARERRLAALAPRQDQAWEQRPHGQPRLHRCPGRPRLAGGLSRWTPRCRVLVGGSRRLRPCKRPWLGGAGRRRLAARSHLLPPGRRFWLPCGAGRRGATEGKERPGCLTGPTVTKKVARGSRDPLEREIEAALDPGRFVGDRSCFSFVSDIEEVEGEIAPLLESAPDRAVALYEAFLAGCYEKVEELDDSSGAFGMFVEDLFCGWVKARHAAGAAPEETASRLLGWMDDDPRGFCYGLETKVASVLDKAGLAALVAQVSERLAISDEPADGPGSAPR